MPTEFRIPITETRAVTLSTSELLFILGARQKSIAWLAREIKASRPMTSLVIHGKRNSRKIREKIVARVAELLAEMPLEKRLSLVKAA